MSARRIPTYFEGHYDDPRTGARMHMQSIHRYVYLARYQRYFSGRVRAVEEIRTGRDVLDVQYTLKMRDPHGNIRGEIAVEFVCELAPVYKERAS